MNKNPPLLPSLPRMARMNTPYLEGEVEKILGQSDHVGPLEDFLRFVEEKGRVSINIGLGQLTEVLDSGFYMNMFELKVSEADIEERYNRRERYFPKLMAFLSLFPDVRNGKYGLLNLGNMGSPWPGFGSGTFCIVLKKPFLELMDREEMVACLKKYSLAYFEDGNVEPTHEFYSDLAIHEYLPHLALLKHHTEVATKQTFWPGMVANVGKFIEIILFGMISTASFEEIRCKAGLWDELDSLEVNRLLDPSPNDDLIGKQWLNLKRICERLKIPLVKHG